MDGDLTAHPEPSNMNDEELAQEAERMRERLNSSVFECSVCYEAYDDNQSDMAPRILCCGHTLCQRCLSDLFERAPVESSGVRAIECPDCRQRTAVGNNGVTELPKNFELLRLKSEIKRYIEDLDRIQANLERKSLGEDRALAAEAEAILARAEAEMVKQRLAELEMKAESLEKEKEEEELKTKELREMAAVKEAEAARLQKEAQNLADKIVAAKKELARHLEMRDPTGAKIFVSSPVTLGAWPLAYTRYTITCKMEARKKENTKDGQAQEKVSTSPVAEAAASIEVLASYLPERKAEVFRRYSDFLWLQDRLRISYPLALIPALPEKQFLNMDQEFVLDRMMGLQAFLRTILRHPVLGHSDDLWTFLTMSTEGFLIIKESSEMQNSQRKNSDDEEGLGGKRNSNTKESAGRRRRSGLSDRKLAAHSSSWGWSAFSAVSHSMPSWIGGAASESGQGNELDLDEEDSIEAELKERYSVSRSPSLLPTYMAQLEATESAVSAGQSFLRRAEGVQVELEAISRCCEELARVEKKEGEVSMSRLMELLHKGFGAFHLKYREQRREAEEQVQQQLRAQLLELRGISELEQRWRRKGRELILAKRERDEKQGREGRAGSYGTLPSTTRERGVTGASRAQLTPSPPAYSSGFNFLDEHTENGLSLESRSSNPFLPPVRGELNDAKDGDLSLSGAQRRVTQLEMEVEAASRSVEKEIVRLKAEQSKELHLSTLRCAKSMVKLAKETRITWSAVSTVLGAGEEEMRERKARIREQVRDLQTPQPWRYREEP